MKQEIATGRLISGPDSEGHKSRNSGNVLNEPNQDSVGILSGEEMGVNKEQSSDAIDELASVFAAYNETSDRMMESYRQLQSEVGRLREQLRQKNEQLERKNRLAALGEMAAGMAHEIRNPLGGIQLYASLLERDLGEREELLTWAQKITNGVRTLDSIVCDILAFTHDQICQKKPIRLRGLLHQVLDYVQPQYELSGVEIDVAGIGEELVVEADENMLIRVFLNLIRNAIDTMDNQGRVVVRAEPYDQDPGYQVRIRVADSGGGIKPEVMEKMFNPFFTTKDTGTGLGLAIVHRLVECHGGVILASNNEIGGATFTLLFP
jgi:signal transduction histidine kinase